MTSQGIVLAVVVTFMLVPPALALNCNYLSGFEKDTCTQINGLPLSEAEKEVMLSASLHQDKSIPNHAFVSSWNNQIQMTTAPDGVAQQNSGVIRDAWIKIASVMPSVLENNTLYVDKQGTIQTFYNYGIQLPTGTASGDCKTLYSLTRQNAQLQVFLNNLIVGTTKVSTFQTAEKGTIQFVSQLTLTTQTKIEHSQNYRYCSRYYSGSRRCRTYTTECRYASTEYKNDNLILLDYLNAQAYQESPSYTFQTLNDYGSSIKGNVNADKYTALQLSFTDSTYKRTNYLYDYVYSLPPYNVVTIRATPFSQETSQNINVKNTNNNSFEFIVKNKQNCLITLFTHFGNTSYSCFPEITLEDISITTDKLHYYANETINVSIKPKGIPITLTYANETYRVQDFISLTANPHYSRISASYNDEQAVQVVSVTEKQSILLASQIGLFFFINYIMFALLTRERRILRWLNVAS